jgi:hypothetical protein
VSATLTFQPRTRVVLRLTTAEEKQADTFAQVWADVVETLPAGQGAEVVKGAAVTETDSNLNARPRR